MEKIYFVICSCTVFACFPVVSDDCCVHNFLVAPSTLLSSTIYPLFFPINIKVSWGLLCGGRGREAATAAMV